MAFRRLVDVVDAVVDDEHEIVDGREDKCDGDRKAAQAQIV